MKYKGIEIRRATRPTEPHCNSCRSDGERWLIRVGLEETGGHTAIVLCTDCLCGFIGAAQLLYQGIAEE